MATNENKIRENYISGREDTRAVWSRASGLEFHYTKKLLREYVKPDSRVLELGCATGYYGMYFADKCAEYVGIDITPENIEVFDEKIKSAGLKNVRAEVGDATKLNLSDNGFDVVLCLGPMYHLPPEERELVFSECKRVAWDSALTAFAYISPIGAYLKGILMRPEKYPNEKANEYCLGKGRDDLRPDVFFYCTPENIAGRAEAHGFTVLRNSGTDFTFDDKLINGMSDEQFKAWMTLSDYMVEAESCSGLANHGLLICRK